MINVLALNNANLVIYWFLVGEIEPILKRQRVDAVSYHQIDKPLAALLSLNEKEKSMDGCFLPPPPLVTGITRENLSRGVRVGRMTHFFSPSSRLDPVSKNMFSLLLKKKKIHFSLAWILLLSRLAFYFPGNCLNVYFLFFLFRE